MAKALVLSEDTLVAPIERPRAAEAAQKPEASMKSPKAQKPPQVPLQIRIAADEAKAIKRAALEADQTVSEFMLSCFHACMKK